MEELSHEGLLKLAATQSRLIDELRATITRLEAANEKLSAANAELSAANEKLRSRVAQLERRISRNSGNSSNPPSADDSPGRVAPTRTKREKNSGRARGKQRGAPGAGLPWREDPDETVPHFPTGNCECGADLAQAADIGVGYSEQVHDIPLVTVTVTQHDRHRVRCGCGREHVAPTPQGSAGGPVGYGPNLAALVVYLLIFHHVPVARAAQLVADLTGATPSTGYVHSLLARAGRQLGAVVAQIKTAIILAHIVGFDETTLRAGPAGTKRHVLTATTEWASLFGLGGRDRNSFEAFGVLAPFAGIAVHDRYSLYDHAQFARTPFAGHQLCCAHLLRDLTDAAETYPCQDWPGEIAAALRHLIGAWHTARDGGQAVIPPPVLDPLLGPFRQAVDTGLETVARLPGGAGVKQPPGRLLLECLHDREADVLRFTTDTRVWPTNNNSERSLRPLKTQQKISGRLPSEATTRHRLTILSYLATAAKHGVNMMTALRDAMAGHPWTMPMPASA